MIGEAEFHEIKEKAIEDSEKIETPISDGDYKKGFLDGIASIEKHFWEVYNKRMED